MSQKMEEKIAEARKGGEFYQSWIDTFKIKKNDAIWVFPKLDQENLEFFKYVEAYKAQRSPERVVVIIPDNDSIPDNNADGFDECFKAPQKEIDAVVTLYALFPFSSRIVICDIDKPEGRMGRLLMNKVCGYTLEEVIGKAVLGL